MSLEERADTKEKSLPSVLCLLISRYEFATLNSALGYI